MDYAGNMKNNHNRSAPEATSGQLQGAARQLSLHPKSGWKQRLLSIASLEDKIVQYALVKILNAVYENDFMGFSYGLQTRAKPARCTGRTGHRAGTHNVNWVLDADIGPRSRQGEPRMADQVHRASDRRPEGNQAHT
jgi:hypothetical protein